MGGFDWFLLIWYVLGVCSYLIGRVALGVAAQSADSRRRSLARVELMEIAMMTRSQRVSAFCGWLVFWPYHLFRTWVDCVT